MNKLVVLGNGPSLKGFDFTTLNGVSTIGMNAAYRFWEKIDWYPDYYVCMDDKVTHTHHKQIFNLIEKNKIKKFFLTRYILDYYPELKYRSNIYFLEQFNPNYKSIAARLEINCIDSVFFKSSNPARITTGSQAVRFGAFLGYSEVSLLGVDLNYQEVKEGVSKESGIELKITSEIKNNPNYFFDDYQSVGDTFNIPNPPHLGDLHFEVFQIISKDMKINCWPVRIFNSNIKSKIYDNETFPFISLNDFLGTKKSTDYSGSENLTGFGSRVLVIDPTYIGHQSATGQLKAKLFSECNEEDIAQVCINFDDTHLRFSKNIHNIKRNSFESFEEDESALIRVIKEFNPSVIYFRPTDSMRLFSLVLALRKEMKFRLVTHFMDDWVLRFKENRVPLFESWERSIRSLVDQSDVLIAISKKMAQAYSFRYGGDWFVIANGVKGDVPSFRKVEASTQSNIVKSDDNDFTFTIRYMGGAAKDMNFQSIVDFAYCVENQFKGRVVFEIYTMDWYLKELKEKFLGYSSVNVYNLVAEDQYEHLLKSSDALLITYNFDSATRRYTNLSMANKMPECLDSGVPVIAYGPSCIATIDYLNRYGLAAVIKSRVTQQIAKSINDLMENREENFTRVIRAQGFVRNELSERRILKKFKSLLFEQISIEADVPNYLPHWNPTHEILTIEKTLINEELNLATSNRFISQGLYMKALIILLSLNYPDNSPLSGVITFNKFYCLKKLGFNHIDSSSLSCRFL